MQWDKKQSRKSINVSSCMTCHLWITETAAKLWKSVHISLEADVWMCHNLFQSFSIVHFRFHGLIHNGFIESCITSTWWKRAFRMNSLFLWHWGEQTIDVNLNLSSNAVLVIAVHIHMSHCVFYGHITSLAPCPNSNQLSPDPDPDPIPTSTLNLVLKPPTFLWCEAQPDCSGVHIWAKSGCSLGYHPHMSQLFISGTCEHLTVSNFNEISFLTAAQRTWDYYKLEKL